MLLSFAAFLPTAAAAAVLASRASLPFEQCPGYAASNVKQSGYTLTADLKLAGPACNTYGLDLIDLKLEVEYQTGWNSIDNRSNAWHLTSDRVSHSRYNLRCRSKCVSSSGISPFKTQCLQSNHGFRSRHPILLRRIPLLICDHTQGWR